MRSRKYVVRLSSEERSGSRRFDFWGKHPAQLLPKARIPLKADVSDAGEGWSDSSIYETLDTSSTISAASAVASSRKGSRGH